MYGVGVGVGGGGDKMSCFFEGGIVAIDSVSKIKE